MPSPEYRVNRIFKSIQGEGVHTGVPATFVRFQGCNLDCPFCDTPEAKSPYGGQATLSPEQLVERILGMAGDTELIVLTGGEPTLQPIGDLVKAIHRAGVYQIHLETNGTLPIPDEIDWVVVSPKGNSSIPQSTILRANEIKWLVAEYEDIPPLVELVHEHSIHPSMISLQPISRGREATRIAYEMALEWGFRLSIQVHKYIGVE